MFPALRPFLLQTTTVLLQYIFEAYPYFTKAQVLIPCALPGCKTLVQHRKIGFNSQDTANFCWSARLGDLVLYCANFSSVRETVRTTMKGTLEHRGTGGKAHQDSYPYFMFIIMQGHAGITPISRVEHALKWAGGCNTCL